jgi:uncharacterized protein (TIGR02996 family)
MATSSSLDSAPIDSEVRSFFHAIKGNPDDDTPRLIFADWLQERGNDADDARGEFLRLNVLRHRLSPDDPTYDLLKRREAELFTEYRWTWLGPLVDAVKSWTFERGMIQITGEAEHLTTPEISAWARTEAGYWVDALNIREIEQHYRNRYRFVEYREQAFNHITQPASSPVLAHLNRLDLCNTHRIAYFFRTVLNAENLPFLTELLLSHTGLTRRELLLLARYRPFRRLALLDLQHNGLDDDSARLLAESPYLKNITELRLGHTRFTASGMGLLRQAFGDRVHF